MDQWPCWLRGEEAGHWICEGRESKAVLRATRGKNVRVRGVREGGVFARLLILRGARRWVCLGRAEDGRRGDCEGNRHYDEKEGKKRKREAEYVTNPKISQNRRRDKDRDI